MKNNYKNPKKTQIIRDTLLYAASNGMIDARIPTDEETLLNIGRKGFIMFDNMSIEVVTLAVKQSYGKKRYLVTPSAGGGQMWVENVEFDMEMMQPKPYFMKLIETIFKSNGIDFNY